MVIRELLIRNDSKIPFLFKYNLIFVKSFDNMIYMI